ncbi:MAG: helix-turn-helix transcriptional regulator [Hyphomicrobiaceae bacterium]
MKATIRSKVDAPPSASWTFLTNHAHVLLCLVESPDARMRNVATRVGITERAVQRIVAELEEAGYLDRMREGRANRYLVHEDLRLRHPVEEHCTIGELVGVVVRSRSRTGPGGKGSRRPRQKSPPLSQS